MPIEYQQEYQLRTGDFDTRAELQPASILDIFQDIAGESAEGVTGLSWDDVQSKGLFWAVSRIKYEVLKTPRLHERVMVRTWPLAPTRMGFQREYTITSLEGDMLVKGTSEWLLMDIETRSFVSALDVYDGPDDFLTEKNFPKRTRKIRDFETAGEPFHVIPAYTDIDVNGHVNNTKYANFALNSWNPPADEHIATFQIDYRAEVHVGEPLDLFTQHGDDVFHAKGLDADGNVKFVCEVGLRA